VFLLSLTSQQKLVVLSVLYEIRKRGGGGAWVEVMLSLTPVKAWNVRKISLQFDTGDFN
jgi:hypothetical protein